MVARPRRLDRRLRHHADERRVSLEKPEQFVAVDDQTFRVDYIRKRQADHAEPGGHHTLRLRQRARDQERRRATPGPRTTSRTTSPAAAPSGSKPGSPAPRPSTPATTTGSAARCPKLRRVIARDIPSPSHPPRADRARRRRHLLRPAAEGRQGPGRGGRGVKVVGVPVPNAIWYVALNTAKAPFNNVRLRQAVAWALPYEKIMQASLFGRGVADVGRPGRSRRS